jgi:hypothetical protein
MCGPVKQVVLTAGRLVNTGFPVLCMNHQRPRSMVEITTTVDKADRVFYCPSCSDRVKINSSKDTADKRTDGSHAMTNG